MSWRRLRVLVAYLPRDSALWRAIYGDDAQWGIPEQLLAGIWDATNAGNWQRAGDPKAKRPQRIPRPGVEDDREVKHTAGTVHSPEEIDRLLARASEVTNGS